MMIISKYFNTIHDYINIVKSCKEYSNIITQYKYNPIPINNTKEREIFNNIEEYHYYKEKEDTEKEMIRNDNRMVKYVHWGKVISYSTWKEKDKERNEYITKRDSNLKLGKDKVKLAKRSFAGKGKYIEELLI